MKDPIKIMFVDDEERARKLLNLCIDWDEIGFQVVGEADGASQALEVIQEQDIDVIIVDIEMPFINGIEFAAILSEEFPQIKIVFLTAHDVFEYAKKGIALGVRQFLLKPIRREELIHTMEELKEEILEERRKIYEYEILKKKIEENKEVMIQNFLNHILLYRVSQKEIEDNFTYYNIPISPFESKYNLILIEPEVSIDIEESILRLIQCKELVSQALKNLNDVILFPDTHQNLVVLSGNKKIDLHAYGIYLGTLIQNKLGMTTHIREGKEVSSLNEIRSSYKVAYQSIQLDNQSESTTFLSNMRSSEQSNLLQDMIENMMEDLNIALQLLSESSAIRVIDNYFKRCINNTAFSKSDIYVFSLSVLNTILVSLKDNQIPYDSIYQTDHLPYVHILKLKDIEEIKKYMIQFIQFTIQQMKYYIQLKENKLIHDVLEYIEKNIQDPSLNLKKIAEVYYVNPSFLSRLFKEVTGVTFINHLISLRIKKAKKLLLYGNKRIYEIAEEVGISDPNYFSKFFKKYTNYTPVQYKEEIGERGAIHEVYDKRDGERGSRNTALFT